MVSKVEGRRNRATRDAFSQERQHVLDVDDTDEMVGISRVDREASVPAVGGMTEDVWQGCVVRDRHHLRAGDHHVTHGEVGKDKGAVDDGVRGRIDQSRLAAGVDHQHQLLRRLHALMTARRLDPEEAHDAVADAVEEDDDRTKGQIEEVDGTRHAQRGRLRPLQGQALRGQLAEDDVQDGDDGEGEAEADGVGHPDALGARQSREALEDRFDQVGQGRFANPAEGEAGNGDAKLGRRDVGIEVVEPAQDRGGPPVPLRRQVLDARAADGDQGKLGGDKKPVGEDEGNDGGEGKRGTNRKILTVAGATGPGTTGDRGPMRPGSPENSSVLSNGKQRRAYTSVEQVLLG
jgi:hypothetical protein